MSPDRGDLTGEPGVRPPQAVSLTRNQARIGIRREGESRAMVGPPGSRRRMGVLAIAAVLACLSGLAG